MTKKCPRCNLNNLLASKACARCLLDLREVSSEPAGTHDNNVGRTVLRRAVICLCVSIFSVVAFYLSLIFTSAPLSETEREKVDRAITLIEKAGFADEAWYLNNLTFFRSDDNWLNATVAKESAYAATNYPFEIMTVYEEFFTYTVDDVERAAILLHEARHLQGNDEKDAYEFVWKHKARLGWTKAKYTGSVVWQNVRKQTREYAPDLFICEFNEYGDCFE